MPSLNEIKLGNLELKKKRAALTDEIAKCSQLYNNATKSTKEVTLQMEEIENQIAKFRIHWDTTIINMKAAAAREKDEVSRKLKLMQLEMENLNELANNNSKAFANKRREICDHNTQWPNKQKELKMMTERMEDLNFRKLRLMKERALTWQDIQDLISDATTLLWEKEHHERQGYEVDKEQADRIKTLYFKLMVYFDYRLFKRGLMNEIIPFPKKTKL